jgi:hypothetical protein
MPPDVRARGLPMSTPRLEQCVSRWLPWRAGRQDTNRIRTYTCRQPRMAHCLGLTEKTAGGPEWLRGEGAVSVMDRSARGLEFPGPLRRSWMLVRIGGCIFNVTRLGAAAEDPADSMASPHVGDVDAGLWAYHSAVGASSPLVLATSSGHATAPLELDRGWCSNHMQTAASPRPSG